MFQWKPERQKIKSVLIFVFPKSE